MPIFKKCVLPESTESKLLTSSEDKKVLDTEEIFTNEEINNEMKDASKKYVGHTQNIIGLQLLEEDPSHAFLHFEKAGKLGCSKANFNLGVCFETGNGIKRDLEKAAHYYKLAASEGHGLALYNLGIYYLEGMGGLEKDENTAIELIEKAAEQNIVEAQVFLGIHYFQCNKRCKAFKYFEKAAKTSTDGQYYLGLCFENGWGTNIDNHQAAKLFSSAAASGHLEAIFSIASYYEKGLGGIEQDIDFAISLYKLAVNAGHKEAEYCLEKLKSSKLSKPTKVKSCDIKRENYECHNIHVSSSSPELSRIGSPVESNFLMDVADCFKDNSQAFWKKVPRKSNFWIDSEVNCGFDAEKELPHWTSTPTLLSVI
ncbi:death ligand signal enhancer-like isoform X2 [Centruroides sculpturatus]|uniref:death ligand signal enhancer-like isoform X1 n=2 Tax=Centruroides sculpturatus TaxID=218467 RepID=UPI000C6DA292|nr:death ligand signal enhancer-like isoform X1 [Centruroides sculpturatus]XP_023227737.1 death ligand signal enhancer-like isoform X2 [Centruroides sculpturatus]